MEAHGHVSGEEDLSDSAALRASASNVGGTRNAKLLRLIDLFPPFRHQSPSIVSWRTASTGRSTAHPKSFAAVLKCRSLDVTIASAYPLIAVSKTISSFGSGSIGCSRTANSTLSHTKANSSRTADTSSVVAPQAARIKGEQERHL
jgi:hypothetical protein